MNVEKLSAVFGAVVSKGGGESLSDIPKDNVWELLSEYGVVLFKGFYASSREFVEYSDKYSRVFFNNGNDTRIDISTEDYLQTVNSGNENIPFHSEASYTPFKPDLCWFYCNEPASDGGETLLSDGENVNELITTEIRSVLERNKLTYVINNIPLTKSRDYFGELLDSYEISKILDDTDGIEYTFTDEGNLNVVYTTKAINYSQFGREVFCNSMISENIFARFNGTEPIPQSLRLQLYQLCAKNHVSIRLSKGEFIMVDNTRVMHGRGRFNDPGRDIYVRMGYSNEGSE